MAASWIEEERVNEEIPTKVEQVEKVPQGGQGIQCSRDAQVPPEGDPIPNVERGIEVSEMSNRKIRESLINIARAMTIKVNLNTMPSVMEIIVTSR